MTQISVGPPNKALKLTKLPPAPWLHGGAVGHRFAAYRHC